MAGPAEPQDLQRGTSALVIARHIRNDIESGRLRHEQQLPSTRALAETWGTSVATINRAMSMLAEEGLVLNRARSSRLVNYPDAAGEAGPEQRRSKVVLIGGYAGSGKTELGRILARKTGWAILDKDTTTRAVVEAALEALDHSPHDRESDLYLEVIRPAEYEALMAALSENVECGNSAIVTAPFIRELNDQAWCERLAASLTGKGADLVVVWVRCDADTMRSYIRHRGAARDTTKLASWDTYLTSVDLDFKPAIAHEVVNNSGDSAPLQEQAATLLNRVTRS
jgi:predicted kinase